MASLRNSFAPAPRRMADGGIVAAVPNLASSLRGWITGNSRPQNQAALQAAGMAPAAPAAPSAPAWQPQAPSGDVSRVTSSNPAGIRFAHGGVVQGPGTGTSDSIPAKLSHGEYVLPADTVRHVGVGNLDALKAATHTPVRSLRGGYANGGLPDPTRPNSFGDLAAGSADPNVQVSQPRVAPGGNAVPGMTTSEFAPTPPIANPNVGAAGSAEAQAFRAQSAGPGPAAPTAPAAPAAPIGPEPTPYNAGRAAGTGLRAGMNALGAGTGTAFETAGNVAPVVASFAPHWDALSDKSPLTTGQKAKLFTRDATRAIGGALGGTAGAAVGGAVGSAVPVAGTIAGTLAGGAVGGKLGFEAADGIGDGLRKGFNYVNGKLGGDPNYITSTDDDLKGAGFDPNKGILDSLKDAYNGYSGPTGVPSANAATAGPNGGTATPSGAGGAYPEAGPVRAAGLAAGAPGASNPSVQPNPDTVYPNGVPAVPGAITRDGNSFSGTGAPAAPVDPEAAHQANLAAMDASSARLQDMASLRNPMDPTPGVTMIGGPDYSDRNADFNNGAALRTAAAQGSWSPRGGYKSNEGAIAAAALPVKLAADARTQTLRNQGDMSRASLEAGTQRRGQDMIQATTLRGQDVDLQAKQMAYRQAMLEHQRQQMNSDRTFGLEKAKYGTETEQKQQGMRDASQSAYAKGLESQYTTTDDKGNQVVDKAAVAEHSAGAQAYVAAQAAAARQAGRPDLAEKMETQGIGGLGEKQKQQIAEGVAMKRLARQANGDAPGTGTFVESQNPMDYRIAGKTTGAMGNSLYKLANGTTVPEKAVEWDKGGNMVLPNSWGNHRVKNFTSIGQPN